MLIGVESPRSAITGDDYHAFVVPASESFPVSMVLYLVKDKAILGKGIYVKRNSSEAVVQVLEKYSESFQFSFLKKNGPFYLGVEFTESAPQENSGNSLLPISSVFLEIKDFDNYEVDEKDLRVLQDDYRILISHYSRLERGDRSPWGREDIEILAARLGRELANRDVVLNPSSYTAAGQKLWERVLKADPYIPHIITKRELTFLRGNAGIILGSLGESELLDLSKSLQYSYKFSKLNREEIHSIYNLIENKLGGKVPELPESSGSVVKEEEERNIFPLLVTHHAVCLCGSYVYQMENETGNFNDIDLLFREYRPNPAALEAVGSFFKPAGKNIHFLVEPKGPNWDYIPLGDFVAWPVNREIPESATRIGQFILETVVLVDNFISKSGNTVYINYSQDAGLELKIRRLFSDEAITFSYIEDGDEPEYTTMSNMEGIYSLLFIPSEYPREHMPETEFLDFYMRGFEHSEAVTEGDEFAESFGEPTIGTSIITKYLPPHKTFVDISFSSPAYLFKPPSQIEVVNIPDREAFWFWSWLKSASSGEIANIARYTSDRSPGRLRWLKDWSPLRRLDRAYRYLYLNFAHLKEMPTIQELIHASRLLRSVTLTSRNPLSMVGIYDSGNALFFYNAVDSDINPEYIDNVINRLVRARGKFVAVIPYSYESELKYADLAEVEIVTETKKRTPVLLVMNYRTREGIDEDDAILDASKLLDDDYVDEASNDKPE